MRGLESRVRERPLVFLLLSVALLILASVAREAMSGVVGLLVWLVLFVPAVVLLAALLRVYWERKRR